MKNSTKITQSGKTFEMGEEAEDKPVDLSEVQKIDEFTVIVKILSSREAIKLDGGLTKQDVVVADAMGIMNETLWEERVD